MSSWEQHQISVHLAASFQVVRELGRGGMGVVFLARDVALHRLVAIKVLRQEFASSEDARARFRNEARMTARLSHPGIVPVHGFGELGDFVYIVMKYVHGESLADRMRREGRLDPAAARDILASLAAALDYAHDERVVHRDLKPENILIERATGRAMLTDFGVALQRSLDPVREEASLAFGTPLYMSPEQAAGELDIDGRSDLYSLGVLGYYMVAGVLPFEGATFEALAAKHIAAAHTPIAERARNAPANLCDAIEGCLRKSRDDRWTRGSQFAAALSATPRRGAAAKRQRFVRTLLRAPVAAAMALLATALKAG